MRNPSRIPAFLFVAMALVPAGGLAQVFTETTVPSLIGGGATVMTAVALDGAGSVWLAEWDGSNVSLSRLDTSGTFSRIPVGPGAVTSSLALGADGSLWFDFATTAAGLTTAEIGRVTPAGTVSTYRANVDQVYKVAAGPDAIWFSGRAGSFGKIGRVPPTGSQKLFTISDAVPSSLTWGPDGALWFLTPGYVGRMTTAGLISKFGRPAGKTGNIVAGADGALWFSEQDAMKVARMTTSGAISEVDLPEGTQNYLGDLAAASDGIWFTFFTDQFEIGRINYAGNFESFTIPKSPGLHNVTGAIAIGSGSAVWFTDAHSVTRLDADACPAAASPFNPSSVGTNFESFAAGTGLSGIQVPGMTFRGTGIAASIQDHIGDLPWSKALTFTQQPGGNLTIDFPVEMSHFHALVAMNTFYGLNSLQVGFEGSNSSGGSGFVPNIPAEAPNPGTSPFVQYSVLDFPNFPQTFGVTFHRLTFSMSGLPEDKLPSITVLLDDIQAEVASPCPLGAPEILTPAVTAVPLDAGSTIGVSWSPAEGIRQDGSYVVELSTDCQFGDVLASIPVAGTSAEIEVPPGAAGSLLYLRVFAMESCGANPLFGPGAARVLSVKEIERQSAAGPTRSRGPRVVSRP